MKPAISIILPTYARPQWLAIAIESIRAQTFDDWELIVVDDCSPDNTQQVVEEFTTYDSRIRLIRNAENKKLTASLNIGFAEARGDFLTWTTDDNRYRPKAMETLHGYLAQHPEIDFVYSNFEFIDSSGDVLRRKTLHPPEYLPAVNCIGPCVLYRRAVAEAVGPYDESKYLSEDYDYWLRVGRDHTIAQIESYLYEFRLHDQRLSVLKSDRQMRVHAQLMKDHFDAYTTRMPRKVRIKYYAELTKKDRANPRRVLHLLPLAYLHPGRFIEMLGRVAFRKC